MRLILLVLASAVVVSSANGQERWRRLPGAASAYAVDLQSLAVRDDILRARVRTHDHGTIAVIQELEVRCAAKQLRTVAEQQYDTDTGRPPSAIGPDRSQREVPWAGYEPGSEGHGLVSSICRIAGERGLLGTAEHSRV